MLTATTQRDTLTDILNKIVANYEGEIYAEDVTAVMDGLGIVPRLYSKVSVTVEQTVNDLIWAKRVPARKNDAERGIKLLLGLAVLS